MMPGLFKRKPLPVCAGCEYYEESVVKHSPWCRRPKLDLIFGSTTRSLCRIERGFITLGGKKGRYFKAVR